MTPSRRTVLRDGAGTLEPIDLLVDRVGHPLRHTAVTEGIQAGAVLADRVVVTVAQLAPDRRELTPQDRLALVRVELLAHLALDVAGHLGIAGGGFGPLDGETEAIVGIGQRTGIVDVVEQPRHTRPSDRFQQSGRGGPIAVGQLLGVCPARARVEVGPVHEQGTGLNDGQQIAAFREATREQRMAIADDAEMVFRRKVSWGVRCGETAMHFTTVDAPAMTRLRIEERQVLDTLIEGGIARSSSEALAWCVRLVGDHEDDWIRELRDAIDRVQEVRDRRP